VTSDESVSAHIERRVDEDHALNRREKHDNTHADTLDADRTRLRQVESELDRCSSP
jgi:Protein of unknown function (DUF2630)